MANTNHQERDSKFWKFVNLAGNAIGANLLFLVMCIPVVTIGPAVCGLYSAVRYMIRQEGWFHGFWEGFKKNFLRTTAIWLVGLGMMVYLVLNFNMALNFYNDGGSSGPMIVYIIGMLFPTTIMAALWPLNIYIPYGTADWLRNAVNTIFKAPLPVLGTAVAMWAPIGLVLYRPDLAYLVLIIIISIYFILVAFGSTLFLKDELLRQLLLHRSQTENNKEENNDE